MWWCVVQDLVLYLYKDEQCGRRSAQHVQLGNQAIRLHHALATRAHDYNKKQHVFRLFTADQAEYLLQTRWAGLPPTDQVSGATSYRPGERGAIYVRKLIM